MGGADFMDTTDFLRSHPDWNEACVPFPWIGIREKSVCMSPGYLYAVAGDERMTAAGDLASVCADFSKKVLYISTRDFPLQLMVKRPGVKTVRTNSFLHVLDLLEWEQPDVLIVDCLRFFPRNDPNGDYSDEEDYDDCERDSWEDVNASRARELRIWAVRHDAICILALVIDDSMVASSSDITLENSFGCLEPTACLADFVLAIRQTEANEKVFDAFVLTDHSGACNVPYTTQLWLDDKRMKFFDSIPSTQRKTKSIPQEEYRTRSGTYEKYNVSIEEVLGSPIMRIDRTVLYRTSGSPVHFNDASGDAFIEADEMPVGLGKKIRHIIGFRETPRGKQLRLQGDMTSRWIHAKECSDLKSPYIAL